VSLGAGGEFDLIRRFLAGSPDPPAGVTLGPGDDAAVLDGGWVVSTDLSVEDVHFRRSWLTAREIGYRAAAAALSDLAAMAAEPVGVLASLAVPGAGGVDAFEVNSGVRAAVEALRAAVIGGDLSRSPGPIVVNVTVLGRTQRPALRAGARIGDEIWVTGTLGAAASAVRIWEAGGDPPADLRAAFTRPSPRVREALRLAESGVLRALIDLSDGLAGDAGHLAAAAGIRAVLLERELPVSAAARAALGDAAAYAAALHGGEDYELCFATAPGALDGSALAAHLGVPLTRVGRMEAGSGVWIEGMDGRVGPIERGGFSHFAKGQA
jgi:thiamine-monophosphate kinase